MYDLSVYMKSEIEWRYKGGDGWLEGSGQFLGVRYIPRWCRPLLIREVLVYSSKSGKADRTRGATKNDELANNNVGSSSLHVWHTMDRS